MSHNLLEPTWIKYILLLNIHSFYRGEKIHAYRYDINVNIPSEPTWNVVILNVAKFDAFHGRGVLPSKMFLRKQKEHTKKNLNYFIFFPYKYQFFYFVNYNIYFMFNKTVIHCKVIVLS